MKRKVWVGAGNSHTCCAMSIRLNENWWTKLIGYILAQN
jgi:hypothetical protein